METPAFLKPIQSYPGEIVQFIERIPGVDVTGDRETVLERLEPYHKAEVEALGWRWKDLRRAEQVHGTKVALVGDIGSNYPVEGVDGLICSGVSDCVLAIYVADCAAVWLYDKENCHRSLIHSGKAGTAGNIVSNTIKSMKKCLGVEPSNRFMIPGWTRRRIPSVFTPTAWKKGKRAACWPFSARITLHGRTRLFFNSGKAKFSFLIQRITILPWCAFLPCSPYTLALDGTGPQSRRGHGRVPLAAGPLRLFRTR